MLFFLIEIKILLLIAALRTLFPEQPALGDARPRIIAHILSAEGVDNADVALKKAVNVTVKFFGNDPELAALHLINTFYAVLMKRADVDVKLLLQLSVICSVLPYDRSKLRASYAAALPVYIRYVKAGTVIAYLYLVKTVRQPGADADYSLFPYTNAVTDGVFYHRLDSQRGHAFSLHQLVLMDNCR